MLLGMAWEYAQDEQGVARGNRAIRSRARTGEGFRTRVGIKAQDGCNNACTFCIVHVARGASRSMPFDQVVDDARKQAQAGRGSSC